MTRLRIAAYQPDLAPNLGAMVRLAACTGAALDVIEPCGFAFSMRALRSQALDYGERVDLTRHADWESFRPPARLVLFSTGGPVPLWSFGFRPDDTLLFGRESAGVPPEVRARADAVVAIPMPGGGRALNVAVSAAVALYEALRQTGGQ